MAGILQGTATCPPCARRVTVQADGTFATHWNVTLKIRCYRSRTPARDVHPIKGLEVSV